MLPVPEVRQRQVARLLAIEVIAQNADHTPNVAGVHMSILALAILQEAPTLKPLAANFGEALPKPLVRLYTSCLHALVQNRLCT